MRNNLGFDNKPIIKLMNKKVNKHKIWKKCNVVLTLKRYILALAVYLFKN